MSTSVFAKKKVSQDIKIGTGGPKGSYFSMTNDMVDYCGDSTGGLITVLNSNGSEENIKGITEKKFAAGLVQEDVLRYYAKKDEGKYNQNNMKVIAGLHMETIHLLLPVGYEPIPADNGWWAKTKAKMSKTEPTVIDINLLSGQRVAAWGGSVLSAEALSMFIGLNMTVVGTTSAKAVSTGLPLIVVAGQPSKTVEDILATGKYELVGINPAAVGSAQFYKGISASYKYHNATQEVQTIGVRALLLGKVKNKQKYNVRMEKFASCVDHFYEEIADDDETHVNWQGAYKLYTQGGRINWGYFEISELKEEDSE